jgi:hypothetical protein
VDQTKRIERLQFKANFRRELIDTSERQIEHHKSMIKNYKAQIKELNRQMEFERTKYDRIPVCTPTSQIRYCYPDGS